MTELRTGQHWRHKKSGGVYEIVSIEARIQVSTLIEEIPNRDIGEFLEEETWIAYRSLTGYVLCFRMKDEFLDGRFEFVKEADE